jgi:hypothetical protein
MIRNLSQEQHSALIRPQRSLDGASTWTKDAQAILSNYFDAAQKKGLVGVSFTPVTDGLGADLVTPFGSGRAFAVNAFIDSKIQIRYIFEKAVTLENGVNGYVKIAEMHIDANGLITAEDGVTLADLNSLHDSEGRQALIEAGLSVVHAFAIETRYLAPAIAQP